MSTVFGADSFDSGRIYLEGQEIHFKNCRQAINKGIAMVPEDRKKQGLTLINSVEYNGTLAALNHMMSGPLVNEKKKKNL